MNTDELIKKIVADTGSSNEEVEAILDSMTTIIGNTLIEGSDVKLNSFGTFKSQEWVSRKIKNIITGEYTYTKPSHRIIFKPSTELKEAIKYTS